MHTFTSILTFAAVVGMLLSTSSCVTIKTEHEIKPIEINLNVKLQRVEEDLDDFFSDLDAASSTL